jgi:hypothetical protein
VWNIVTSFRVPYSRGTDSFRSSFHTGFKLPLMTDVCAFCNSDKMKFNTTKKCVVLN